YKGKRVRYKDVVTGEFKEITYNAEHTETSSYLYCKQGGFLIRASAPDVIEPIDDFVPPGENERSEERLSRVSSGTASILGYKAYIRRTNGGTEVWSVPEFGSSLPLKTIFASPGSSAYKSSEAVSIEWVSLPANFFDLPPNFKVDTRRLEARIENAERVNDALLAERLKAQLAKWKAIEK
ncbi:MAG: hypothetical protein ACRD2L_20920, partial [Terriglobia bacterium]